MVLPDAEGLPPERLPRRLEAVRFYVDEDLRPVGNAMMWARTDVVVCGASSIADELPLGTPDVEWIPAIAAHTWIAVTGNDRIRRNPEESRLAVDNRLRAVCPQDREGRSDHVGETLPRHAALGCRRALHRPAPRRPLVVERHGVRAEGAAVLGDADRMTAVVMDVS